MVRAAIVPERDRARLPAEPAGELGLRDMLAEPVDPGPALGLGPALETHRVGAVEIERLLAGVGMGADHRMPGFQRLFPVEADCGHRALEFGELSGPPGLRIADLRAGEAPEPGKRRLHAVRERVIGELGVGEQRVAAVRRRLDGVEQGAERRLLQIGGVGMPEAAEIEGLLRLLDDRDHLRAFLQPGDEGIAVAGAEARGEIALPGRRQVLAAEEDHPVFEEGAADFRETVVGNRRGEVHAPDFGPERARDRRNLDLAVFHRLPPGRRQAGAGDGDRTHGTRLGKPMLYH